MKLQQILFVAVGILSTTCAVSAKALNNAEVSKLLAAQMSDDVIVTVITNAKEKDFDTSPDALTALKKQGASDAVIKAVLGLSQPAATPAPAAAAAAGETYEADEIYVLVNGKYEQLSYANAEVRTAARALGFGGAGQYAVLHGPSASRAVEATPTFLVALPKSAQPNSYITLANFAVRPNGDREVLVGNATFGQVRIGIVKDRVIPLNVVKAEDQSKAGKNVVIYTVTPLGGLKPGQYAFVEKLGQSGLGQASGTFYDFEVK